MAHHLKRAYEFFAQAQITLQGGIRNTGGKALAQMTSACVEMHHIHPDTTFTAPTSATVASGKNRVAGEKKVLKEVRAAATEATTGLCEKVQQISVAAYSNDHQIVSTIHQAITATATGATLTNLVNELKRIRKRIFDHDWNGDKIDETFLHDEGIAATGSESLDVVKAALKRFDSFKLDPRKIAAAIEADALSPTAATTRTIETLTKPLTNVGLAVDSYVKTIFTVAVKVETVLTRCQKKSSPMSRLLCFCDEMWNLAGALNAILQPFQDKPMQAFFSSPMMIGIRRKRSVREFSRAIVPSGHMRTNTVKQFLVLLLDSGKDIFFISKKNIYIFSQYFYYY